MPSAITASWSDNASATAPTIETRGVTAVAASLLLPALTTEDAAVLAEDEGLVTHLTNLVLIDEAGDIQQNRAGDAQGSAAVSSHIYGIGSWGCAKFQPWRHKRGCGRERSGGCLRVMATVKSPRPRRSQRPPFPRGGDILQPNHCCRGALLTAVLRGEPGR
jgi:hypothetical protein